MKKVMKNVAAVGVTLELYICSQLSSAFGLTPSVPSAGSDWSQQVRGCELDDYHVTDGMFLSAWQGPSVHWSPEGTSTYVWPFMDIMRIS
ncbi:hypothetical protein CgunFtcFv8_011176 [Champsocephalus gunnari]|uniref:Uncharacterized protein n=1 Tax=Champsocephalus gunnari TaxID=52237 RepID=A0AAN8HV84_CHAGU|nr:hypothetical protein CgunFtcFv8_011176 [Champsocephalus gunnari]